MFRFRLLAAPLILVASWSPLLCGQCEPQALVATDTSAGDLFGMGLSLHGDVAVIGGRSDDGDAVDAGVAHVFERTPDGWQQTVTLRPSDPSAQAWFGWGVHVDGSRAFVGAPGKASSRGKVYVFERDEQGGWSQNGQIVPLTRNSLDFFGLSMDSFGEELLVGAREAHTSVVDSGAAFLFRRESGRWNQVLRLAPDTPLADGRFGHSVDFHDDRIIVGAFGSNQFRGRAYIFERSGEDWRQVANLRAPERDLDDRFGMDVAIEGDVAVVGCRWDDERGRDAGSAFVYEREESGQWVAVQQLFADPVVVGGEFGDRVCLRGDRLLIGAMGNVGGGPGAAYLFERTDRGWTQTRMLTDPVGQGGDGFGHHVALSDDSALVGIWSSNTVGVDAGKAWMEPLSSSYLGRSRQSVSAGDALSLGVCGGEAGQPILVFVSRLGGQVTCFQSGLGGVLDDLGQWQQSLVLPMGLGVQELSLQAISRRSDGPLDLSNEIDLKLR